MSRITANEENNPTQFHGGSDHAIGRFIQITDSRFAASGLDIQGEGYVFDWDEMSGTTTNFADIDINVLNVEGKAYAQRKIDAFIDALDPKNILTELVRLKDIKERLGGKMRLTHDEAIEMDEYITTKEIVWGKAKTFVKLYKEVIEYEAQVAAYMAQGQPPSEPVELYTIDTEVDAATLSLQQQQEYEAESYWNGTHWDCRVKDTVIESEEYKAPESEIGGWPIEYDEPSIRREALANYLRETPPVQHPQGGLNNEEIETLRVAQQSWEAGKVQDEGYIVKTVEPHPLWKNGTGTRSER